MGLFSFKKKKDDWYLLHSLRGTWNIQISSYSDATNDKYCYFDIYYSENEDRVKMEMNGYKPSEHPLLKSAKQIIVLYDEALLKNDDLKELKGNIDKQISELYK
jgi:hypothetical protein